MTSATAARKLGRPCALTARISMLEALCSHTAGELAAIAEQFETQRRNTELSMASRLQSQRHRDQLRRLIETLCRESKPGEDDTDTGV